MAQRTKAHLNGPPGREQDRRTFGEASSDSWMNLVECRFRIVERQTVRRGVFKSVKDLNAKVRGFIEGWNNPAHPFVWTTAQILKVANRPTTSNSRQ